MLNEREIIRFRKLIKNADYTTVTGFKALSDLNRYKILRILIERSGLSISDIAKILNISKPLTSTHMKILLHAKLINKERLGKKAISDVNLKNPFVRAIIQAIIVTLQ